MELQWPLIVFTTLVAWSAGLFGTQALMAVFGVGKKAQVPAWVCSAVLLAAGGIAVFFHLEHWERIFNGFGHLTSGITQELIAIVVLAVVAVAYLVLMRKSDDGASVPKWLAWVAVALSVVLVAVMAHDALGADHVHGVMLPGPYSSESSIDDAEALALALGISNITVPICEPFEAFEAVLARACGGALTGLAAENTQARCRMVCLMALSNAHGWLMLNTGNKSEAAMGYSTLYGDTAGAFAPLGGVYKTDVFAMARWRNRRAVEGGTCGPIPVNVFVKPPSAELAPDQEDEKSLGVDYATLDRILIAYVEEGRDAAAIVAESGLSRDLVDYVIARTDANAFKRALEPPYPDASFYGAPASR